MTLPDYLERLERLADDLGEPSPRVAIWDQFEEFFTLHPGRWKEREGCIRQLAVALQADPLLRAVLSMREAYIAQMDPYAPFLPDRLRARLRLERVGPEAALEALTRPLATMGQAFAPGVAERLVEDLLRVRIINPSGETMEVAGQYVEPLQLQVVAQTLWNGLATDTMVITEQDLQRFGNANQALLVFYEEVIRQVAQQVAVQEEKLRDWFEHNLIRAEARAGARWYELTHDRLIQPIQLSNEQWRKNAKSRGWRKFLRPLGGH